MSTTIQILSGKQIRINESQINLTKLYNNIYVLFMGANGEEKIMLKNIMDSLVKVRLSLNEWYKSGGKLDQIEKTRHSSPPGSFTVEAPAPTLEEAALVEAKTAKGEEIVKKEVERKPPTSVYEEQLKNYKKIDGVRVVGEENAI